MTKPTEQSCSNSISSVPLQISPTNFFFLILHKKEANKLSDKHSLPSTLVNLVLNLHAISISESWLKHSLPSTLANLVLNLHAISISESWLKHSLPSTLVNLENYCLLRNDRIGKRGGGVAMYVRKDNPRGSHSLIGCHRKHRPIVFEVSS